MARGAAGSGRWGRGRGRSGGAGGRRSAPRPGADQAATASAGASHSWDSEGTMLIQSYPALRPRVQVGVVSKCLRHLFHRLAKPSFASFHPETTEFLWTRNCQIKSLFGIAPALRSMLDLKFLQIHGFMELGMSSSKKSMDFLDLELWQTASNFHIVHSSGNDGGHEICRSVLTDHVRTLLAPYLAEGFLPEAKCNIVAQKSVDKIIASDANKIPSNEILMKNYISHNKRKIKQLMKEYVQEVWGDVCRSKASSCEVRMLTN
ncbi:hypothetical protein ACP4OV_026265 [Aristida adscensionis]